MDPKPLTNGSKCPGCAALIRDDRSKYCPYCGVLIPHVPMNPTAALAAPERFAAVERSSEFDALMKHAPSGAGQIAGGGVLIAFMLVWTIAAGGMALFMSNFAPTLFVVVPALMSAFGVFVIVKTVLKTAKFSGAELERFVAVVRDERTAVSGGGQHSSASTHHYFLLENRDGQRREYECRSKDAGLTAPGDIGVAYVRDDVLLEFRRVEA